MQSHIMSSFVLWCLTLLCISAAALGVKDEKISLLEDKPLHKKASDPCLNYEVLDESWRNVKIPFKSKCDYPDKRFPGWFRISGAAGNRMPTQCVPKLHCGTAAPLWMVGSHPDVADGVVTRKVCGSHYSGCCEYPQPVNTLQVKKCPQGYYVYYLGRVSYCALAYCAVHDTSDPCLNSNCSHTCVNRNGKAVCTCPAQHVLEADQMKCVLPCSVKNGGCSHVCNNTRDGKAVCSCPKHLVMGPDGKTCVPPCSIHNGNCSHMCNNTDNGNAVCGCPQNMVLKSDKSTCSVNECLKDSGGCSHICVRPEFSDSYHCECPSKDLKLGKNGMICQSPDVTMTCTDTYMQVDFLRSVFHGLDETHLQLVDPQCQATGNKTFLTFKAQLDDCGMTMKFTDSLVIYENKVTTRPNYTSSLKGTVFWAGDVDIPIRCKYPRNHFVTSSFKPLMNKLTFEQEGYGKLTYKIEQYPTDNFIQAYSEQSYPIAVNVREKMFFQLSVFSIKNNLQLFVKSCKGTPTSNPRDNMQYLLIDDGCPVGNGIQFMKSPSPKIVRFSAKAFQFVHGSQHVYLHCEMMVCDANDQASRCAKGCLSQGSNGIIGKRSYEDGTSDATSRLLSLGGALVVYE